MFALRTFLISTTTVFSLSLAVPAIAQSDRPIPVVATFSILAWISTHSESVTCCERSVRPCRDFRAQAVPIGHTLSAQ